MFVIGITGPSGAGKGVISGILSSLGMRVIDADKVYSEVITPPSECLMELAREFGNEILNSDGALDRKALSKLVFGEENRERLLLLNKITHKYVVRRIRETADWYRVQGEKACVIDAPLLIEAGLCDDCDLTIAVLADKALRIERISRRDGITCEAAMARINSQKSDEFYSSNTDCVIYNDTDIETLKSNVKGLLKDRKCGCL